MNEDLKINQGGNSITLREFGVQQGSSCNGTPTAIKEPLNVVFDQYIRDQKDIQTRSNDLLNSKKSQISEIENATSKARNGISEKEQKIRTIEETIKHKESEISDIKESKDAATGIVPFVIGAFIVILLTLYLFVFYSSTGYSALFGVKPGNTGFINPNVFMEGVEKGGGVIAMLILFPVIFLGLGFLIHDAIERKKYFFISMIIGFTFLTDALIGYKITQNIYQIEYQSGLHDIEWQPIFVFNEINFYIILSLGFIVYLIWGALLHYVLSKYKEISEPERIISLKREIEKLRVEIGQLNEGIAIMKNEIADLEKNKSNLQRDIDDILSGKLIVDPNVLDSYVGQFMGGWLGYIGLLHANNQQLCTEMMQNSIDEKDRWFNTKITIKY